MAGQMMHADERESGGGGRGFRERHADQQRTDEAGTLRDGDRAEIVPGGPCVGQRAIDDAADVADVLARGELRHDAAPLAVDGHLRGDHVRANRPRLRRVAGLFDDRGRCFVAGGFDAEDLHAVAGGWRWLSAGTANAAPVASNARLSDSAYGARKMPRSVMMPAM